MALLHPAQKLNTLQRDEAIRRLQRRANPRKQQREELELLVLRNDEKRAFDLPEIQDLARGVRPWPGSNEETRDGGCELGLRQHHGVEELGDGVERGEDDGRAEEAENRVEEAWREGTDEVPRTELQEKVELSVVREDAAPRAVGARRFGGRGAAREDDELRELADATGLLEGAATLDLLLEEKGKSAGEGFARVAEHEEQTAQKDLQVEFFLEVRRVQLAD